MPKELEIYNSLSRKKEVFKAIDPPFLGLYVCGPTVYGEPHLGHARSAVTFDIVYRYLKYLGYKVRYVRNITDVGHLENDSDDGEDKIAKKARLEKIEPMEVVQFYTIKYHESMDALNIERPSIEPSASGHIMEQIEQVQKILDNGYAYEVNGSVYFDVSKYAQDYPYGKLSGKKLEDLQAGSRTLDAQDEKQAPEDFALWKKANPEHIMKWKSPWSLGFPGWHMECTSMSTKYLGETFDIHGGGMDLQFPHHEAEIAQSNSACGKPPCNYWMHNNMLTINGKKMGKSLGNFINLEELFNGTHKLLEQAYHPMTVRFFMLQAHYRSTLDFSNEALQAAEKGLKRLMQAHQLLMKLETGNEKDAGTEDKNVLESLEQAEAHLADDFNTAQCIARLFDITPVINKLSERKLQLAKSTIETLQKKFDALVTDVLGLKPMERGNEEVVDGLMNLLIDIRKEARFKKDFATSDKIRDDLAKVNIQLKDSKEGTSWEITD
ncbi:MAG: cysteine--tRNA ligase [Chitinophagales bacterium]